MRRRASAVVLTAIAVVAVVVLALLGIAVLDVGRDVERIDDSIRYGAGTLDPSVRERPLGVRVGEALLGADDDLVYRDAVELARSAGLERQPPGVAVARRVEAEAMLARVLQSDGDRRLRARAANLLGVLLFEDAKSSRSSPRRFLEQSLGAFQDAVTLDARFEVAKANLEVLATLPAGTSFRRAGTQGDTASSSGEAGGGY